MQMNYFEKTYAHFLSISLSERYSGKTSAYAQRIWRVRREFYGSSVNKFRWGMKRASFYVLLFLWIGLKGKKHSFTNSSP